MEYAAYWRHDPSISLPLIVFQRPDGNPPQPRRLLRDPPSPKIHNLKEAAIGL